MNDRLPLVAPERPDVRLLIPVTAAEKSRWGIRYALRLASGGRSVQAIVINVAERVDDWRVRRFLTRSEVASFMKDFAVAIAEDAATPLRAAGIPCRCESRSGDVMRALLDAADEHRCDAVVLPRPRRRLLGFGSEGVIERICAHYPPGRVVLVDACGDEAAIALR